MSLPQLPRRAMPWSPNVYEANSILRELYQRPIALLSSGNYNLHRVKLHQETLLHDAIPLLLKIEEAASDEGIPLHWVHEVADHFAHLLAELESAKATAGDR